LADKEVLDILWQQDRWLYGRCVALARLLAPRSPEGKVSASSVEDLACDVQGAVLERFFESDRRGWFDQHAHASRAAQVRTLLKFCLMQEQKVRFSDLAEASRRANGYVDEEGEFVDPLDAVPDDARLAPDQQLSERRRLGALRAQVLALPNPNRKLTILATHLRPHVAKEHFTDAAAFVAGGSRFLARDPREAWTLFTEAHASHGDDDSPEWRRVFAEIVRSDSPLGELPEPLLRKAVNSVEQTLSRALQDLRLTASALEGDE